MFEKGYAECSHEEKLQVRLQHKNTHSLTGTGLPENHRHVRQSKRVDYAVLESNTRRCPHRGGGRGCVYSPQRCTPSWRRPPTSGHLRTGIPWTTRIAPGGDNSYCLGHDYSCGRWRKLAVVWGSFRRRCGSHLRRHCWRIRACIHDSDGTAVAGAVFSRWARRLPHPVPSMASRVVARFCDVREETSV
jgi:hypothetical protein